MDNQPTVTTDQLARCLEVLKLAEGPATAVEIAGKLYLDGHNIESRRRHVRALMTELRNRGHWIIGTPAGCWLTADQQIWLDYCEHRAIDAKRIIGEASGRKRSVLQDKSGQGFLFTPNKV